MVSSEHCGCSRSYSAAEPADDAELLGGELHAALEGGGIRDLERVILFETSWVRRANLADAAVHP